jgi:signal transduction histidine kinase
MKRLLAFYWFITTSFTASAQKNITTILLRAFYIFFGWHSAFGRSLSYDIVKAHGGELEVKSNEGDGSLFTIQLPLE